MNHINKFHCKYLLNYNRYRSIELYDFKTFFLLTRSTLHSKSGNLLFAKCFINNNLKTPVRKQKVPKTIKLNEDDNEEINDNNDL